MTRRFTLAGLSAALVGVAAVLSLALGSLLPRQRQASSSAEHTIGIDWAIGISLVALALTTWLLLATLAQLGAEVCTIGRRFRRMADAIAPASIRALGRGAATAAATVSLVVTSPAPSTPSTRTEPTHVDRSDRARLVPLPADPPVTAHLEPLALPPLTPPPTTPPPIGATSSAAPTISAEAVVQPGASFWTIAETAVAAARGREPSEREVADYWLRLIAANGDRLVIPGVPDLLYAGQVLRVPPVDGTNGAPAVLPETL